MLKLLLPCILINFLYFYGVNTKMKDRCSLARELYYKHKVSKSLIPSVLCLSENLSGFNTTLITQNEDGSKNYGLFQFNEAIECKMCEIDCEQLADRRLSDDVRCWRAIFNKFGFSYWKSWVQKCKGKFLMPYLHGCSLY